MITAWKLKSLVRSIFKKWLQQMFRYIWMVEVRRSSVAPVQMPADQRWRTYIIKHRSEV